MDTNLQSHIESQLAIHPATRLGHVHLTVADLERQVEFYQQVIGLKLHWRDEATAGLGVGDEDLLRLTEARRYPGTTGIYHFAILLPNRYTPQQMAAMTYELLYRKPPPT